MIIQAGTTHETDPADLREVLADPRRKVTLDGVHNFRDLGGYPALGGTTRWGLVYRADGLQRLTNSDVEVLRDRGLGAVIDLRTDVELSERGRFPLDQHAVRFHHLPVLDRTWVAGSIPDFDNAHDFLMWAYRDMIRVGSTNLATGLRVIASTDSTLVFHCAAGKDRTGILAALLLATLGVPDDYIAADYAKTEEGMQLMLESWRKAAQDNPPPDPSKVSMPPAFYFASPPAVMQAFLDHLATEHGSVLQFVRSLGITDDEIDALREKMIEPAA